MEDTSIIALYFARDELAILETDKKYGARCRHIAMNILSVREDAEECLNDTYHAAWNQIPPERPLKLFAYLGRIVRNLSISRYRSLQAKKRCQGLEVLLSELEDCLPSPTDVEREFEGRVLSDTISSWLDSLSPEDRVLFVRRYWFGDSLKDLALEIGRPQNQLAQRMYRLRQQLRGVLEKEGITV